MEDISLDQLFHISVLHSTQIINLSMKLKFMRIWFMRKISILLQELLLALEIKKSLKLKVYLPGKTKNGDKFGSDPTASLTSWDLDGKVNLTDIHLLLRFNTITKKL